MNVVKEQKQPLFFLFTCIKDGNDYIDKLFESLLKQTKINFIHFIYEDGSSKPLGNKVIEYQNKVANLKKPYQVIYEYNPVNIGLNKSTQYCISKCNCPYFIWIDCDNFVDIHFFEELEKTYKKNKKSILLRSLLYDARDNSLRRCNCGTIKEAHKKNQLGYLIRRKYYYSFFAVNYEQYKHINPQNIMLNVRNFFNDEQVLLLCLLSRCRTSISEKAIGYFTTREDQESALDHLSADDLRKKHISLCELVGSESKQRIENVYIIKDLFDEFFIKYRVDYQKSKQLLKKIRRLSKDNKITLKNYYDSNLIKNFFRIYYWRFKNIWKN